MNDLVTVRGRKHIRLGKITFAAVEPTADSLMNDKKFVEKVKTAYRVQVELNHGWGFTVRHRGFVIRFDLQNSTGYKLPRVYEGHVLEEPKTVQLSLLEVTGL
ncbi:hypothetical protein KEJ45_04885 [Candidatus Bathyarchaeota archaeon]|nr:hypothetical protein [Candidatus Bathyarchaeota archaeon]